MFFFKAFRQIVFLFLLALMLAGCKAVQSETKIFSLPSVTAPAPGLPVRSLPAITPETPSPTPFVAAYAFSGSIDPSKYYIFYLHGKIIEDQGIPAISPDYGEYEYAAILEKLSGYGFVVISERRPKDTDGLEYARKIAGQVMTLLDAGVPAKNITVVGASKGAGIAIFVSNLLENKEINFVILAICDPATVTELKQNQVSLYGNVLSIFDSSDELAGSCQDLFSFSEGKGLSRYDEIILKVGTGHGILYKPLDEWIIPTVQWAGKP